MYLSMRNLVAEDCIYTVMLSHNLDNVQLRATVGHFWMNICVEALKTRVIRCNRVHLLSILAAASWLPYAYSD